MGIDGGKEQTVNGVYNWANARWTNPGDMMIPGEHFQCHVFGHRQLMVIGGRERGTPLHKVCKVIFF